MKAILSVVVACFLIGAVALSTAPSSSGTRSSVPSGYQLPGVALAETASQITGVAISPLLGVSTVGAWRYLHTSPAQREHLPWFCHPAAWGIGFTVLALCLLKDVFGTIAPGLLKKPLDVVELFENKLSALVAGAAFVPLLAAELSKSWQLEASQEPALELFSAFPVPPLTLITVPLAVIGFFTVWLAAHVINVLIVLSPFGIVDAALKLVRTALLSTVVASAFLSPWIGAAVCVLLLLVAAWITPWAFRLMVYATCLATDILFRRSSRSCPDLLKGVPVFSAGKLEAIPPRTRGKLFCDPSGQIVFRVRPIWRLSAQEFSLPASGLSIARGLWFSTLFFRDAGARKSMQLVTFLPRHSAHVEQLAGQLSIVEVRDTTALRGFRAIREWLTALLGGRISSTAPFQSATASALPGR